MDFYTNQEEAAELRGLVRVLGTKEAQIAAETYMLSMYLYTEMMR